MRERPILFAAPMIRAILAGAKTQTRRLLSPQPQLAIMDAATSRSFHAAMDVGLIPKDEPAVWRWRGTFCTPWPRCADRWSPFGVPGDRLWVRETFALIWPGEYEPDDIRENEVEYRADHPGKRYPGEWPDCPASETDSSCPKWRPSLHMPRWASRLTLEITDVRVERLQDISEADARAEGIPLDVWDAALIAPNYLTDGEFFQNWREEEPHFAKSDRIAVESYRALWDSLNAKRAPWSSNPWVWVLSFKRVESADRKVVAHG